MKKELEKGNGAVEITLMSLIESIRAYSTTKRNHFSLLIEDTTLYLQLIVDYIKPIFEKAKYNVSVVNGDDTLSLSQN